MDFLSTPSEARPDPGFTLAQRPRLSLNGMRGISFELEVIQVQRRRRLLDSLLMAINCLRF